MNRHLFLSLLLALFASSTLSADNLKIEPAFWWSGMKNPELQLMVYGKDIAGYLPSVKYPGVQLKSSVALESPNYLLIWTWKRPSPAGLISRSRRTKRVSITRMS